MLSPPALIIFLTLPCQMPGPLPADRHAPAGHLQFAHHNPTTTDSACLSSPASALNNKSKTKATSDAALYPLHDRSSSGTTTPSVDTPRILLSTCLSSPTKQPFH